MLTAETTAEGPAAVPLDPPDKERGLVTRGIIALGGIGPDTMGGVGPDTMGGMGRAIDPDPLLTDPAGV